MDRFEEMKVFTRVVEMSSFSKAAEALALPESTVSDIVKRTENRLGVKLLDRNTQTSRPVVPTLDGQIWYRKCLRIVGDVEEAEAGFLGTLPRGRLRIDVQGTLARYFLLPQLSDFLDECPGIELQITEENRLVDPIHEDVDCVLRVGIPEDSDLVARHLGMLQEVTVASPAYLSRNGTPKSPDQLEGHCQIGYLSLARGTSRPLSFTVDGQQIEHEIRAAFITTGTETMMVAARLGMGLIQAPRYQLAGDLATGRLVEVMPETPPASSPVLVLYPRERQLSPRLHIFLDWLGSIDFNA